MPVPILSFRWIDDKCDEGIMAVCTHIGGHLASIMDLCSAKEAKAERWMVRDSKI
jgi:hypothetical protein